MMINGKKIGIWGFGIVGASVMRFLLHNRFGVVPKNISIIDQRTLGKTEKAAIETARVYQYPSSALEQFLEENDLIIPSAGIDLRPFAAYEHKWLPRS